MLVAAAFKMDPVDGFPAGTPLGQPATFSTHAMIHNLGGSLSFLSMLVLCGVLARRFAADGHRVFSITGWIAAAAFAGGLGWAMSGGTAGALTLFLGVVVAWGWIAAVSAVLLSRTYGERPGSPRMSDRLEATTLVA